MGDETILKAIFTATAGPRSDLPVCVCDVQDPADGSAGEGVQHLYLQPFSGAPPDEGGEAVHQRAAQPDSGCHQHQIPVVLTLYCILDGSPEGLPGDDVRLRHWAGEEK